jgi:hypothetical protein
MRRHPTRLREVLGLALAAWSLAVTAGADEPWIVSGPERITTPGELGDVIVVDGGSLVVEGVPEPGVRFEGNLWAIGTGTVEISGSVVEFASRYHGQYALVGIDDADIRIRDSVYRVTPGVQHGLVVAGSATIEVSDTDFGDVQLVAAGDAEFHATRLNGSFEVIVQEAASMELTDIPRLPDEGRVWVWVEIGAGSTVDWSPPLPGFVNQWSWPPPDATGVPQTVTMTRCETLLWPMLVREGSDLTLRDVPEDGWVVVGLHLPDDTVVETLVNDVRVEDAELMLPDRRLRLVDARIDTWNLYPQRRAVVDVRDSVLGEILSFDDSVVRVERSVIDGTGGFLGAQDRSRMSFTGSLLTCTIEATDAATLTLHHSTVMPYPADIDGTFTRFAAWDDARLAVDHTTVETLPSAGGAGSITVVWVEPSSWPPPAAGEISLWGTIAVYGEDGSPGLARWWIDAVGPRGDSTRVAEGTAGVEKDVLATWNDPLEGSRLVITVEDGRGRSVTAYRELDPTPPARPIDASARRRP